MMIKGLCTFYLAVIVRDFRGNLGSGMHGGIEGWKVVGYERVIRIHCSSLSLFMADCTCRLND
ncbi:MAG: hypothetical protein QS748_12900 [Candidatus Endonucleobacter bathymodioli]|uniref:Uncharacterized protein n=1 Tax=Candidatus Endonucleibacter bathymodioli TaxID=539814 RepID=A0AA90SNF9_9GAMM|nr:hypothetical protein [Candidatus Endonucleobacter bathymodioli]